MTIDTPTSPRILRTEPYEGTIELPPIPEDQGQTESSAAPNEPVAEPAPVEAAAPAEPAAEPAPTEVAEATAPEAPVAEEAVAEAPAAEEPVAEEPVAEEPAAEVAAPAKSVGGGGSLKDKITSVAEQLAYCRKADKK